MSNYSTSMMSSGTTWTVTGSGGGIPITPAGLIVTRAVETKEDGWRGQILVDKKIAWESGLCAYRSAAIDSANERVVTVIRGLFE